MSRNSEPLFLEEEKSVLKAFEESAPIKVGDVARILDVGCGDGRMTEEYLRILTAAPERIVLIDPDSEKRNAASERIRKSYPRTHLEGNTHLFPGVIEEPFDLIILSYSLPYLHPRIIRTLHEGLRSGGHIVMLLGHSKTGEADPAREYLATWKESPISRTTFTIAGGAVHEIIWIGKAQT